jgi:hypothetical protein
LPNFSPVAAKIGGTAQTLNEWIKKGEIDSGKRAGVSTDVAKRDGRRTLRRRSPGTIKEQLSELGGDGEKLPLLPVLTLLS